MQQTPFLLKLSTMEQSGNLCIFPLGMLVWDNSQLKSTRGLLADLITGKVSSGPVTNCKIGTFQTSRGYSDASGSRSLWEMPTQFDEKKLQAAGTTEGWALLPSPSRNSCEHSRVVVVR